MNMRRTAAVTVVVVLLAAASVLYLGTMARSGGGQPSGGASTTAPGSLQLRLAINATSLPAGGRLLISVSEFNTETSADNASAATLWKVSGLSVGECGNAPYPFGVALYQGRYTPENVSQAEPIRVYPVVPCPLFIRLITGYLFEPTSDSATILPGTGAPVPMAANVTVSGEYSGSSLLPLAPGTYTVAAGDEWGALLLLHVSVGGQAQAGPAYIPLDLSSFATHLLASQTTTPALSMRERVIA